MTKEVLSEIYRDPIRGLRDEESLLRTAQKPDASVKRKNVQDYLLGSVTHTTHILKRKKFPRRKILVARPQVTMTCDLADMTHLSKFNKGYRYLLVCIDAFSLYMQVIPLKSKKGN